MRDLESAFPGRTDEPEELLFAREQGVQPRFAAIGGIAMDNTALGRFIERRNQIVNFFQIRLGGRASPSLQRAQTRSHAAVLSRTRERLSGTFCCGSSVRHS